MENKQPIEQLTNKQRTEVERQEKLELKEKAIKKRQIKQAINLAIGIAVIVLPIGGLIWYSVTRPPVPESEILSRSGLHWHPEITIYIKGVKQEIPGNLGIGASFMFPVHTHESGGVIHLEFDGLVRKDDITLGQFFKSWRKDIRSLGANMSMTVNGIENTEYENYHMQDKDKIELHYD